MLQSDLSSDFIMSSFPCGSIIAYNHSVLLSFILLLYIVYDEITFELCGRSDRFITDTGSLNSIYSSLYDFMNTGC